MGRSGVSAWASICVLAEEIGLTAGFSYRHCFSVREAHDVEVAFMDGAAMTTPALHSPGRITEMET